MVKINSTLKKLIENNPLSFSTVGVDKKPHIIYVASVKVDKDKILITDNFMNQTKLNLSKNSFVSLSLLVGQAGFEILGVAKYFSNGKVVDFVKKLPENNNLPSKGAIRVTVSKIKKMK